MRRSWKSFMTDHFCPIELSWEWGYPGDSRTIRFSSEPISLERRTVADPLNQYSVSRLVHRYQHILPQCDIRCFDHFSKELLSYNISGSETGRSTGPTEHESRTFIAFDFSTQGVMLKAYFIPTFRALEAAKSALTLISEAIQSLPDYTPSRYTGLSALLNFYRTSSDSAKLEAEIFAIDCVDPAVSKLKIYMRGRSTCFNSVQDIMKQGGVGVEPNLARRLKELHRLWHLVLGKKLDFSPSEGLNHKDHRTAGILYYFDIRPGQVLPGVKVYIPHSTTAQTILL
ncbi:hypothetical protein MMC27_004049 [Xylographa pallens]|nr:hypothetical protein [Xylographa pallens]